MQTDITHHPILENKQSFFFSEGLPAFESVKEFVLISNEEEAPFLWLQATSNPNLAFITIDPFLIVPNYEPDISDEDVRHLKIENSDDVFLMSIVNVRNTRHGKMTLNLVSPIVINLKEKIGKQVILQNHLLYSVEHKIEES